MPARMCHATARIHAPRAPPTDRTAWTLRVATRDTQALATPSSRLAPLCPRHESRLNPKQHEEETVRVY
jgi:hypothetical protein